MKVRDQDRSNWKLIDDLWCNYYLAKAYKAMKMIAFSIWCYPDSYIISVIRPLTHSDSVPSPTSCQNYGLQVENEYSMEKIQQTSHIQIPWFWDKRLSNRIERPHPTAQLIEKIELLRWRQQQRMLASYSTEIESFCEKNLVCSTVMTPWNAWIRTIIEMNGGYKLNSL